MRNRLKVLGITGGIAAGKSSAAHYLRKRGGFIIDADKISHDVISSAGPAYKDVLEAIEGDYILGNGEIDRKKLGEIVFNNREKLETLEGIVHKHVSGFIYAEIDRIRQNPGQYKFIVIDVPLLIGSGLDELCEQIWIISADYDTRINRIVERNGLTKKQAANRIKAQTDWSKFKNDGYILIDNNEKVSGLFQQLDGALECFLK